MRLNKHFVGGLVGPVSCLGVAGLFLVGLICPQMANIYAEGPEDTLEMQGVSFSIDRMKIDGIEKTGNADVSFGVDRMMMDGVEVKNTDTENWDGTERTPTPMGVEFNVIGFTHAQYEEMGVQFNVVGLGRGEKTIPVEFDVTEYLELTAATTPLEVNMTGSYGEVVKKAEEFTVAGNNQNGFGVYVYTAGSSTSLKGENALNSTEITSIEDTTSLSSLDPGTWGWNVTTAETTTLKPVKAATGITADDVAWSTQGPAKQTLKLTCGAKVSDTQVADTYSTDIVISAVAPYNASMIPETGN